MSDPTDKPATKLDPTGKPATMSSPTAKPATMSSLTAKPATTSWSPSKPATTSAPTAKRATMSWYPSRSATISLAATIAAAKERLKAGGKTSPAAQIVDPNANPELRRYDHLIDQHKLLFNKYHRLHRYSAWQEAQWAAEIISGRHDLAAIEAIEHELEVLTDGVRIARFRSLDAYMAVKEVEKKLPHEGCYDYKMSFGREAAVIGASTRDLGM